jgi:hypothetical protein
VGDKREVIVSTTVNPSIIGLDKLENAASFTGSRNDVFNQPAIQNRDLESAKVITSNKMGL